jgi:hypothetical protein
VGRAKSRAPHSDTLAIENRGKMSDDKNIPIGLAALSIPPIISGVYSVFYLLVLAFASNVGQNVILSPPNPPFLLIASAIFFFILSVSMILLFKVAYFVYVVFYGYQLIFLIFLALKSGQYGQILFSTTAQINAAMLFGAFYYRSFFFKNNNDSILQC